MNENEIPWIQCMDACTDGAKSMIGSIKGVVSRIKKKFLNVSTFTVKFRIS